MATGYGIPKYPSAVLYCTVHDLEILVNRQVLLGTRAQRPKYWWVPLGTESPSIPIP